ncbi:copper transporter [Corynebacterium uterequi]|uniref:Putative DUF3186 family protein n=1 Tax=Corynebacterium uterequi TaxID=1072256 RepID=A0A0G3HIP6_9CORY|nr:copper transporter [Corynebacterium uterequi]AKK11037.1 putative DUF3186 family protein [Corynebacterium uterequi]
MSRRAGRAPLLIAGLGFGVALGTALGAFVLAPTMPDAAGSAQPTAPTAQPAEASSGAKEIVAAWGPRVVADTLVGRPVIIMASPGANDADVAALADALHRAGAIDAGRIDVTDSLFATSGADALRTIAAETLPAGASLSEGSLDSGTHAGELLGSALLLGPADAAPLATTEERALVLSTLRDAGMLSYEEGTIRPAQAVVFVGGESADPAVVESMARFVEALRGRGAGVVVAASGDADGSDTDGAGVADTLAAAGSPVSTVDTVADPWSPSSVVLAVAEQISGASGHYGRGEGVTGLVPAAPDRPETNSFGGEQQR